MNKVNPQVKGITEGKVQEEAAAKCEPAFSNVLDLPDVKHNKLKNQGAKMRDPSQRSKFLKMKTEGTRHHIPVQEVPSNYASQIWGMLL